MERFFKGMLVKGMIRFLFCMGGLVFNLEGGVVRGKEVAGSLGYMWGRVVGF